jgi:3-oxoacid CoA-transferase A subunit
MSINKLYDSFDKAVADVYDGAVIIIGGFTAGGAGIASYLIRALVRQGAKDLTIVCNTPGQGRQPDGAMGGARRPMKVPPKSDNAGLLIQHGQVSHVLAPFPGMMNAFSDMISSGKLTVEMLPQGTLAERIRAARAGIPAFYTATGVGTVMEKGKEVRTFDGRQYVMERALKADFAFIRAHQADRWGNLTYQGTSRNFNATMAGAAKVTIAEVDEMVELGGIRPEATATPSIYVNRIVCRETSIEEKGVV